MPVVGILYGVSGEEVFLTIRAVSAFPSVKLTVIVCSPSYGAISLVPSDSG